MSVELAAQHTRATPIVPVLLSSSRGRYAQSVRYRDSVRSQPDLGPMALDRLGHDPE